LAKVITIVPQKSEHTCGKKQKYFVNTGEVQNKDEHTKYCCNAIFQKRPTEPKHSGENYSYDCGPDARNKRLKLRDRSVDNVQMSKSESNQAGGENETHTRKEQSSPSFPQITDMNRHFGGIGPGYEIGGADQIQKAFMRNPILFPDDLIFHHSNVGSRSAESESPEFQKET
jgi:hypothetical protein